jgi:hypothetical protein
MDETTMKEIERLTQLDALATNEAPSAEDFRAVMQLISGEEKAARFFFERAQAPGWVDMVDSEMLNNTSDLVVSRVILPFVIDSLAHDYSRFVELIQQVHGHLDEWAINKVINASLNFPPEQAIQLGQIIHNKMLELGILGRSTLPNYITHISTELPENTYALDLLRSLISFAPDPDYDKKQDARNAPDDEFGFNSRLEPRSLFDASAYEELLDSGVKPLSAQHPFSVAETLIDALATMLPYRFFSDADELISGDDYSEVWCQRLDQQTYRHLDHEETLSQACFSACVQVYEQNNLPEIDKLDLKLRESNWLIFKRIRQYIYSKFPDKAKKEWFQEFIRESNRNYGERNHHFEFQRMLSIACAKYGCELFDEGELEGYLEAILSGPDKQKWIEGCKSWNNIEPTDEDFAKRQAHFHRTQLHPFADVLYGEYKERYEALEAEALGRGDEVTNDDDYHPILMRGGTVRFRSPKDTSEMEGMPDEDLFNYLEEWNNPQHIHSAKDEPVHIDHNSLSGAFKQHFDKVIGKDATRICWWLNKAKTFSRPLYCAATVDALSGLVESKQHDLLKDYFDYCDWVLSHEDIVPQVQWDEGREDADQKKQSWSSSRSAVRSFAVQCLSEKSELSQDWRERVFNLYKQLCSGKDANLEKDREGKYTRNAHSLVSTAINQTRSRALEDLFKYTNWVRKAEDTKCEVPEVTELIDQRLANKPVLTDAENVLLAMHFGHLRWLNPEWAESHVSDIFSHDDAELWQACFSAYLTHSGGYLHDFQYLKPEYLHAFTEVALGEEIDKDGDDKDSYQINKWMGYHLLTFYLSGRIELTSKDDLCMELFYKATQSRKELWGDLFNHIGHSLGNWGAEVDAKVIERVKALFEWRIEQAEPKELSEYIFWLDGTCLEPEWRMEGFLRTLPFADDDDVKASMITDKLHEHFLESHPDMALKCFAEVTKAANRKRYFYVSKESAIPILKKGLASQNQATKAFAEEARENLLKAGRFEYLHLEEE